MNYEKKWFAIAVILLFTGVTLIPTITADTRITSSEKQYVEVEKIFNDLKVKFDKVTTKQEALDLFKEAIVELNEHGLLPKGMSLCQAQRLVTSCFSRSDLAQPFQSNTENNTGNTNCLVVGMTNRTIFRPFPSILDIRIFSYLLTQTKLTAVLMPFTYVYGFRVLQPFKLGPRAYVGERHKLVENGNVTYDSINSSSGWIWTLGMNGEKKWNGTFYGSLFTKYFRHDGTDFYSEIWHPVGIRGFVGINFFNFISFGSSGVYPSFFIGFAREINFTYSPPWT